MTALQKIFGLFFVAAVTIGFIIGMKEAGWQFDLGVLSGVAIMQFAHRAVYGRWIDF